MKPMNKLTGFVVVLAAIWSGWWFVGSTLALREAKAVLASYVQHRGEASYSKMSIAGFPNRFDLTVNDLTLGNPAAGVRWSAPFAQVLALSYNPFHFIFALPNDQQIATPDGTLDLASQRMRASVEFVPGLSFALKEFVAVADKPVLTSSLGWSLSATRMRAAARQFPGVPATQEIGIAVDQATPGAALRAALDPAGALPATIGQIYLDAEAETAEPIDRKSLSTAPRLTRIRVKDAHVTWGALVLSAQGSVTMDANGVPEGRISIRARHWRDLVPVLAGLGIIRPEVEPTVTNMLAELTKDSAEPEVVDLPLAFQNGFMSIGPLPLGPAPRLN